MFKGIGCNEMRCICGQHFCFVCGRGFDLIDDLRRHFSQPVPDWCPYYNLPDNPAAVYRDAWTDPRSEGGWHFPELLPGGRIMGDNAKQVALLDRSIRQYRRTVIGGTEIEQYCVRGLLLAARHVLALMHSREIREEQATAMDVEGIHERLRFAHFASIYRCFLQQLATCENHAAMLPTTTSLSTTPIDWYGHFSKMRRLCLRDMATEQHWRERKEDYSVLQDKIAEAWRYGGYDEDLPAPDSVSQDQRPRAQTRLRAKELLRCLRELLALLSANSRNRFSASRSFYLINKSAAVARLLHEIETSGAAAFRDSGPDTRLAYDAACFLAQRLLEEEREELEHWVSDADSRAMHVSRMWAREIALVCLEVKDEISPSPLPADIIELGDSARRLQIIVHDHYRTTDAKDELYDLWHQYTHHGHADRILPNPGDGPLKPLFFKLLASLQYIKERWDAPVLEEEGFPDSSGMYMTTCDRSGRTLMGYRRARPSKRCGISTCSRRGVSTRSRPHRDGPGRGLALAARDGGRRVWLDRGGVRAACRGSSIPADATDVGSR